MVALALMAVWPLRVLVAEDAADHAFFESKVRPLLVEHCHRCHSQGAEKVKGELRVDTRSALLRGGETGPAVVPGHPEKSLLIKAVGYTDRDLQMPPKTRLSPQQVADLTEWVRRGAPWPASSVAASAAVDAPVVDMAKRRAQWWAWQSVRATPPPAVGDAVWPRGDIDRHILAGLEANGLRPAPPADRRTLIRRLYADLVGLPPPPDAVDAFLADTRPDAVERVIDGLLAAPAFGERWARHWLDLVRYGESRGHEFDYVIPNAWQYRDWVVRALNADLPYDRFVTEQIAGDLIVEPRTHPVDGFNESVIGTGFWSLGEGVHSPVDIRQDQADRFDNMIDVAGKTFLGLTVACARCHDHKFDAITANDYYALSGFLESSSYRLVRFDTQLQHRAIAQRLWRLRDEHRAGIAAALAASFQPGIAALEGYLLAAQAAGREAADPAALARLASARRLDAAVLAAWVEHLAEAAKRPADPFHLFAKPSDAVGATPPAVESPADALLVDYAAPGDEGWLPDDVAFGSRPQRIGELRLGDDPTRPIAEVCTQAAAAFDPVWSGLKRAPGAVNDPVGLDYERAGRTIRTRTVALEHVAVHALIRGSGRIYAAVSQHAVISPPLHGALIKKVDSTTGWQWHSLDLAAYRGLRAHFEFTATSADFAVARVVQGKRPPLPAGNRLLAKTLAAASGPAALAGAYRRLFEQVAARLGGDRIGRGEDAADVAELADWLVRHPRLIGAGAVPLAAAQPFLAAQAALIAGIRPESRLAMALMDGSGEDAYVMKRGQWRNRGESAPRRLVAAIAGTDQPRITRGSGRLDLARRLVDPSNPFISRVLVNRLWHHLFGRGLVASVDNFGALGGEPSHPALLDHLATTFMRDGWSLKRALRGMVLSATYQMASTADPAADQRDPDNRWLHRMAVRRLDAEAIRDAILVVSGRIDPAVGGPSVAIHLTSFLDGRGRPASGPIDGAGRRSLYLAVRRNFLDPLLQVFDAPAPFNAMGRRSVSNVPAQALTLMNDPFVIASAQRWARNLLAQPGLDHRQRVITLFTSAFARPPTPEELDAVNAFLVRQAATLGLDPARGRDSAAVWADLTHALINAKEFIFIN